MKQSKEVFGNVDVKFWLRVSTNLKKEHVSSRGLVPKNLKLQISSSQKQTNKQTVVREFLIKIYARDPCYHER